MIQLLKTRRSIRKYDEREIEKEKLDLILKAALLSPSSKGKRPWEFIVVMDKHTLKNVSRCRTVGGGPFIANASVAIVVLADTEKTSDVWVEDASIAATLIQLESHKLGLGSCWVQVRERMHDDKITAEEYLRKELNIPEKFGVECIISLGYPAENRPAYEEKDIDFSKVHYEKF